MGSNGTYSLFPEEADSSFAGKYNLFCDSDESEWKKRKKKKGKKKKLKKYEKALNGLLKEKKGKKKSKNKAKKQSKREFQYRLIEKSADTILDTTSDIAKMYAESKFFPAGRGK